MIMIIGAYVHFMALWKSNGKRTATPKARGHLHFFLQNSVNILNKLKCIRHLSLFYDQAEISLSYSLHLYHAFDIAYPGSMWDACHNDMNPVGAQLTLEYLWLSGRGFKHGIQRSQI